MNQRHFSPNNRNQSTPNHQQSGPQSFGGYTSPPWQSPPWGPQRGAHRHSSGGFNDRRRWNQTRPNNSFNSPNNFSNRPNKSYNESCSPHSNQKFSPGHRNSFDSSNSGFIPLPYTPNNARHSSPYPRGGNNRRFAGGRGGNRKSFSNKQPIENYFKPSMIEYPWKDLSKEIESASVAKSS